MTLTEALPSLRRSIPDPLETDRWPELTTATPTDLVVAGISMNRLVELCGTPCVHTGAAVIPGTHGIPSQDESGTVVVVEVESVSGAEVVVDARLDHLPAVWSEARLLGRASTAHHHRVSVSCRGGRVVHAASLPDDLVEGDLLALPCPGLLAVRDVRSGS